MILRFSPKHPALIFPSREALYSHALAEGFTTSEFQGVTPPFPIVKILEVRAQFNPKAEPEVYVLIGHTVIIPDGTRRVLHKDVKL